MFKAFCKVKLLTIKFGLSHLMLILVIKSTLSYKVNGEY